MKKKERDVVANASAGASSHVMSLSLCMFDKSVCVLCVLPSFAQHRRH